MTDRDFNFIKMKEAEALAETVLLSNNYHDQHILRCCATCKNSNRIEFEDPLTCNYVEEVTDGWQISVPSDFGICDKYEPKQGRD